MKEIKTLAKRIRAELEDATEYAKLALQYRDSDRIASETYKQLAEQELEHSNKLHAQAVRLINEQKAKGVNAPVAMQAVWDWEHENMIQATAHVRMLLQELR